MSARSTGLGMRPSALGLSALRPTFLLLAALAMPITIAAQAPVSRVSPCSYRACGLSISPRWNGLAVVRGAAGTPAATLSFFWPRDVSGALRGDSIDASGADSAVAQARRALGLRRIGAVLTDAGAVLGAVALVRALNAGRLRRSDGVIAAAGAASLGVSIPFQFAADGALSRAVWWHNLRYSQR